MSIASPDVSVHEADAQGERALPHTLPLGDYLSTSRWTLLAVALTVFGVFLPTVIVPYAFSDDYSILWMADGWGSSAQFGKNILDWSAIMGRPFAGLQIQWAFAAAGTLDNLRFLRLFSVLTIVLLAIALHWSLVRVRITPLPAALIAVLLCCLPPFQVYASWAVLYNAPLATLLAGAGSIVTVAAVDGHREFRRDRLVGAALLVLAALLIYQPAAMFFWVFFAVALVGAVEQSDRSLRLINTHFGVGIAAMALAYLEIKVTVHFMGSSTRGADRNALTHDVTGKATWFFHEPLFRSLNLFDITPSRWFAVLVAIVATGGIGLWLVRRGARPLMFGAVALILVPLTYLPNLAVVESWAAYRTQVSINALVALYACLGALALLVS